VIDLTGDADEDEENEKSEATTTYLELLDELALQETAEVSRHSPGRYVAMVMATDDGTLFLTVLRLIVPENTSEFR
jgi:hypothetical protein